MPGPDVAYYAAVAERMVPFLRGRKVAVEQRFPGTDHPVYRRHEGGGDTRRWIAIRDAADVERWARQYAVAFHAHLQPNGPGCWFVLDIDGRGLPLAMAQLATLFALDALDAAGLRALVTFSGSDGFHVMWNIPSLRQLGGQSIWDLEQAMVQALADLVGPRLATDPRAAPVRAAVGPGQPLIATGSQDEANKRALLFDKFILKPNVNVRVPYSLHARSGLVALPLDRTDLAAFDDRMAAPAAVMAQPGAAAMPDNDLAAVRQALKIWSEEG